MPIWIIISDVASIRTTATVHLGDGPTITKIALDCEAEVPELTNEQLLDFALTRLQGLLDQLYLKKHLVERQIYIKNPMGIAAVGHQAGTCRFGTDPATSVLDVNCKAHELDNLYVVDTSFFPSIGAVNPSLTAIANAIRVVEHLKERLAV